MDVLPESNPDLPILEQIEENPDANQATIASQMDVAVGTINWHLKRLIAKGYVKVKRLNRKKLRYIITPEGIALRARLTVNYISNQFHLFRLVRERTAQALQEIKASGYLEVQIQGQGDVADVCKLVCMEHGFRVVSDGNSPTLVVRDLKIFVEYQKGLEHVSK
jgi:DNA-binding MarR family transcriptional regulator